MGLTLFAWLSVFASVLCFSLGFAVYLLNKKETLNRLFMLTLLFNSYWAFGEFMTAQAATAEAAYFWVKVMFLWPFWIALLLHFTLVFTESRLLKKKLTYVLMYFPAAFFAIIDLTTNWISAQPVEQYWGYTYTAQETMFSVADSFWVSTIGILSLVLCAVYQHRVSDPVKKQQAKFVSIGLACPVVLSLVTDNILPTLGITFPSLSSLSGCFFSAFIAYAMWRYELFNLNAAVAAENIVNAMPDSLILANLDGRIIRVNDHVVELTGYSCQELDGKQFTDLFMAKAQGQAVLTALEANKELRDLEAKFQTKNGNIRSCLLSGSVVKNKNGRSLGLTFIVHDLTRFKQMEQRLVETERFASIGKLAGMVGHDLRNPLVSMNGATYYLKTRYAPKLDKNGLEMLDAIEKSIAYSNKIVNDLLDYSREIRLDLETATAKSLLDASFSMVSVPANIDVVQHAAETPAVKVDATKITRVFVNLLTNAFDAMPQGGTLTITAAQTGRCLEFIFDDTGGGMTDETLSKLWNPLFTTKAKGMGFGLVICKRIVEAHSGEIKVCTVLGQGTTFTVVLPLNPDSVPEQFGSAAAV